MISPFGFIVTYPAAYAEIPSPPTSSAGRYPAGIVPIVTERLAARVPEIVSIPDKKTASPCFIRFRSPDRLEAMVQGMISVFTLSAVA